LQYSSCKFTKSENLFLISVTVSLALGNFVFDSDPNAKETVTEIKKRFSDFVNLHEEYCNDVDLVGHVIPRRPAKNSKNYVKNMVTDSIKSN
jgi:hypothetical protein